MKEEPGVAFNVWVFIIKRQHRIIWEAMALAGGFHLWLLSSGSCHDLATETLGDLMYINERGVNVTPQGYRQFWLCSKNLEMTSTEVR